MNLKITQIKLRRLNLGLSDSKKAAELLKISMSSFYKLEHGYRKPSPELIARMAKVYQCTTDEIFEDFNITG
ncbi:helix-turn-helix domain-containing protein [uncultured Clostridium sp.]|uniref:helix-turn-helix domain-containing protein n=1 Tax=uncultured Clostridium sp. TaxID=59620 RepID=UPI0035A599CE